VDTYIEGMMPYGEDGGGSGDDPRRNFWGKFWAILLGGYCF